jgi:uncharacterized tellurite resistance protein B-like protein
MAVANLKPNLLDTLKSDVGVAELDGGAEQIFLTPYLALACGLLYMMASDGELEAQESSQLQAVLGGDKAVLGYALRYVQSVPVEQFFATASELLSVKDKWCILTNVCDALLADGHADRAELALFAQMTTAFGVRETQFEPYFKILALKNDKSVLGKYTGVRDERQPMTPHFALAIALLYMLTSDGSIGTQEVGQLEAAIGEFEGLQNVALKYVRSVKLKQFLDEASALLRPEQKIYILTNVCDSMLSDGEVAHLEDKLFLNMLTAFGFTEKTFARYLQVLETKNFKPFDTSAFKNRVTHERLTGSDEEAGITFKNELMDATGGAANDLLEAANQGVWVGAAGDSEMSQFIARTMSDNIQSVSDDFESQGNVVKVGLNATDGLNLQKLGDDDAIKNRQRIDGAGPSDNVQQIDVSAQDANRQQVASIDAIANRQSIDLDGPGVNVQTLDVDASDLHREAIAPEVRLQNIHEVAEEVNHRLDRFESAHFSFLQIGRAQKFNDAFVLIEDDASDMNRQLVNASFARLGLDFSSSETGGGVDVSPDATHEAQDASEKNDVHDGQDPVVLPAVTVAHMATSPINEGSTLSANLKHVISKRDGPRDAVLSRGRGFRYVQFVVATFAIAFAAPIETRMTFGRSVAGPLIVMPVLTPAFIEQRNVLESELSSVQERAR